MLYLMKGAALNWKEGQWEKKIWICWNNTTRTGLNHGSSSSNTLNSVT